MPQHKVFKVLDLEQVSDPDGEFGPINGLGKIFPFNFDYLSCCAVTITIGIVSVSRSSFKIRRAS